MRPTSLALLALAAAAALVAGCAGPTPAAGGKAEVLPFVENDYPAALAEARARDLPMFVEAWAPW